jgi:hypothetical protein
MECSTPVEMKLPLSRGAPYFVRPRADPVHKDAANYYGLNFVSAILTELDWWCKRGEKLCRRKVIMSYLRKVEMSY